MPIAFFPGKFQPPHLGHVLTICRLRKKYDRVIVGITNDVPRVIDRNEIRNIFKLVFEDSIDILIFDGKLTEWKSSMGLPDFDELVSGNGEVLHWGRRMGIKSVMTPRTEGIGYSGTEIRDLYKKRSKNL